jgi:hypothetical protein
MLPESPTWIVGFAGTSSIAFQASEESAGHAEGEDKLLIAWIFRHCVDVSGMRPAAVP